LTFEVFWQCGILCFSIDLWSVLTVWYSLFFYWPLKCSDSGILCFSIDFCSVLTVWYSLFFYWPLKCSDSVVFFVFLLIFEVFWQCGRKTKNTTLSEQFKSQQKNKEYHTVRTVQRSIEKQRIPHCQNTSKVNRKTKNNTLSEHFKGQDSVVFFVFLLTFELFWQCGILCFSADFWTVLTVVFVFLLTFEVFWQCGILCFSIDLWTVLTVCYSLFFYWPLKCSDSVLFFVFLLTFELFWQCGILCFSIDLWTVQKE
jgi:hypothetical protein